MATREENLKKKMIKLMKNKIIKKKNQKLQI